MKKRVLELSKTDATPGALEEVFAEALYRLIEVMDDDEEGAIDAIAEVLLMFRVAYLEADAEALGKIRRVMHARLPRSRS